MNNLNLVYETHPYVKLFPEMGSDEFYHFKNDIIANGLLNPIVLTHDGKIIDGYHRYQACKETGMEPFFVTLDKDVDLLDFVISANLHRRHLNTSQRAVIALEVKEVISRGGKEKEETRKSSLGERSQVSDNERDFSENRKVDSTVQAAKALNIGKQSVADAQYIKDHGEPEDLREISAGGKTVHEKKKEVQERVKQQKLLENQIMPFIKLEDWNGDLNLPESTTKVFNKQTNENIDWAKYSWNPVTGCVHGCEFCYARDIAKDPRGGPYDQLGKIEDRFLPTIWPEKLVIPYKMKPPTESAGDVSYKNVFTCSMADLFGKWVPKEWIEAVFKSVRENPQWNFLFLTKFPQKYLDLEFPDNAWIGATVNKQNQVKAIENLFEKIHAPIKWLSLEPMYEKLTFEKPHIFDWWVVGGASPSKQTNDTPATPAYEVPFEQQMHIYNQATSNGIEVYFKSNIGRPKGFPQETFGWKKRGLNGKEIWKLRPKDLPDAKKPKNDEERFVLAWDYYHRVTGREPEEKLAAWKHWKKLTKSIQQDAVDYIPKFYQKRGGDHQDPDFFPFFRSYLSKQVWKDE